MTEWDRDFVPVSGIARSVSWLCVIVMMTAFVSKDVIAAPSQEVTQIEESVLEYRRTIKTGHVELRATTYFDGSEFANRSTVTTIWFDDKSLRNDLELRYQKNDPSHREIRCRNCERDGYVVRYSFQIMDGAVMTVSLHEIDLLADPASMPVIDPRLLGLFPDSTPNGIMYHDESYLRRFDRDEPSLHEDTWEEMDCWRVEYVTLNDVRIRIWIVPAQGPSVVRMEQEWHAKGKRDGHFLDRIEVGLSRVEPAGIWYPESIVYERTKDGVSLEREVVDVVVRSMNEPLDSSTFQLIGMGIPAGTPVSGYLDPRGSVEWDGREIVATSVSDHFLPPIEQEKRRSLLLIGNAILLALLGAFFLWRYLKVTRTQ